MQTVVTSEQKRNSLKGTDRIDYRCSSKSIQIKRPIRVAALQGQEKHYQSDYITEKRN